MTAPNRAPQNDKAVAPAGGVTVPPTTRPELSPAHAAVIMERRATNEVARQLANLSWGKGLTAIALQAAAEYCRRYRIDPATEIDILGGKIYRNANYYTRRGAELLRAGVVDDIQVVHCNADDRLTALAKRQVEGAQEELDRRELLRIKHNIPDAALGAVVVRVRIAKTGIWLEGANDAGYGQDPVGKADPGKTAETRAYRRVWKLLVDTVPALREEEQAMEQATASVSATVKRETERAEEVRAGQPGQKQLHAGAWDGAYGVSGPAPEAEAAIVEREPGEESEEDLQLFDQEIAEREGQR